MVNYYYYIHGDIPLHPHNMSNSMSSSSTHNLNIIFVSLVYFSLHIHNYYDCSLLFVCFLSTFNINLIIIIIMNVHIGLTELVQVFMRGGGPVPL